MFYNEGMSLSSGRLNDAEERTFRSNHGVYPISVVTELTGIGPHTLRGYERAGLLTPARTGGGSRRYSDDDLARLRRILTLSDDRVNLEGIRRILLLEQEVAALRAQIARLRSSRGRDPANPEPSGPAPAEQTPGKDAAAAPD